MSEFFSPDYQTARDRFRRASSKAGANLHSLPLSVKSPNNSDLSIDIAWIGSSHPKHVILQISGTHGVEGFARIVALGDGLWDLRAAHNLGLAFIGIADGARAVALRQAGARHLIADYRDLDGLVALLDRAEVP